MALCAEEMMVIVDLSFVFCGRLTASGPFIALCCNPLSYDDRILYPSSPFWLKIQPLHPGSKYSFSCLEPRDLTQGDQQ